MLNTAFLLLATALALAQFFVPRRWIYFPLLIAICHTPYNEGLFIGGLKFTAIRLVICAALLRAYVSRALDAVGRRR